MPYAPRIKAAQAAYQEAMRRQKTWRQAVSDAVAAAGSQRDTVTLPLRWETHSHDFFELMLGSVCVGYIIYGCNGWFLSPGIRDLKPASHPTLEAAKTALEAAVRAMEDQP